MGIYVDKNVIFRGRKQLKYSPEFHKLKHFELVHAPLLTL